MTTTTTAPCWGIKSGYQENPVPVYFLDDSKQDGIVFQPDVYTFAEWLTRVAGSYTIVDVGCGYADKLAGIHERNPGWELIGIDYGDNLAHCRDVHTWGQWVERDLERAQPLVARPGADPVVICSDVIEHLADPRPMLAMIRDLNPLHVIFSTPERDVQYGYDHNGPPPNLCHIREWNAAELRAFLEGEHFTVHHSGLTRGNDRGPACATQLVVASC